MAVTLQDARNVFYDILREDEDVSAYPLILCDLLLNSAQDDFCSGLFINPVPQNSDLKDARKGRLPFLQTDVFYSNVQVTTLSVDAVIGGNTLTIADTTNFPTAGSLFIAGNTVPYTNTTPTQFTGCSNILFAHLAGSQVSIAFPMPADYMSTINVIYNNYMKLRSIPYDDVFEQFNSYKAADNMGYFANNTNNTLLNTYGIEPFYTIKDNQYIIVYNLNATGGMIKLRYEKQAPMLTDSTDEFIIDDDTVCKTLIPLWAVGKMLYQRGEEKRAADILNFAIAEAKKAYRKYNIQSYEDISGVAFGLQKRGNGLNI